MFKSDGLADNPRHAYSDRNLKISQKKFADLKIVRIFAVQYRGIEQLVARRAHNPEAGGSSPPPATNEEKSKDFSSFFVYIHTKMVSPDSTQSSTVTSNEIG